MISVKFYDNGGATIDRYTVVFDVFGYGFAYCMSDKPSHPQGICYNVLGYKPGAAWTRRQGTRLRGNHSIPVGVRLMAADLLKEMME